MLPKTNRINKRNEFDRFFGAAFKKARGFSSSTKNLLVKVLPTEKKLSRVGFIINTKVDKRASVRNLLKRRLREIMRANLTLFTGPKDMLLVVAPNLKKLDNDQLKNEVLAILKKLHLIK